MANLKELSDRIDSVKGTKRITNAMKMVAAAKLRRATEGAESARPYAERMEKILSSLASGANEGSSPLLTGTGSDKRHLLLVVTSDRGLCGGFNSSIIRKVAEDARRLEAEGKSVQMVIVGRKGVVGLRTEFGDKFTAVYEELCKPSPDYDGAVQVAEDVMARFEKGEFDVCTLYFSKFVSALTQIVTPLQLVPFAASEKEDNAGTSSNYDYEPSEDEILTDLLPRNVKIQVFRGLLESFASEQGARMAAMDNATRNAGDMIKSLSVEYNRSRQAKITSELIEIISGAEAL